MAKLSGDEIEECTEVFDLFDFWDGRDGLVDAAKVGDFLRCLGMNPTEAQCMAVGACKKMGEKQYKLDELMPIYAEMLNSKSQGTQADFLECFKTFDREGQGFISAAELRHCLSGMADRLTDEEVEEIFKSTDTLEDLEGNVKYLDFIDKVMAGPQK